MKKYNNQGQLEFVLVFSDDEMAPATVRTGMRFKKAVEHRNIDVAMRAAIPFEPVHFVPYHFEPDLSGLRMRPVGGGHSGLKPIKHYRKHI